MLGRNALFLGVLALGAAGAGAAGCATGGETPPDGTDDGGGTTSEGGPSDGGRDAACPTGKTGPGCSQCAKGYHMCGASNCLPDQANTPDAGCTQGCGMACATPMNASAKCTSQGGCDFDCNATYIKSDAGCACDVGMNDCGGTCAQCCSPSDCPTHTQCNSGTCGGCDPGWGDCNGNPADGCETHLNSTSNCGACGHSCCGSFCGCGFLGVGGENCNASGASFSCGC